MCVAQVRKVRIRFPPAGSQCELAAEAQASLRSRWAPSGPLAVPMSARLRREPPPCGGPRATPRKKRSGAACRKWRTPDGDGDLRRGRPVIFSGETAVGSRTDVPGPVCNALSPRLRRRYPSTMCETEPITTSQPRDRWFESGSLQRRVRGEPDFGGRSPSKTIGGPIGPSSMRSRPFLSRYCAGSPP